MTILPNPRNHSFGERLARGFNATAQSTGEKLTKLYTDRDKADKLSGAKKKAAHSKRLDELGTYVDKALKVHSPDLGINRKSVSEISKLASDLIKANPDLANHEALDQAVQKFRTGLEKEGTFGDREQGFFGRGSDRLGREAERRGTGALGALGEGREQAFGKLARQQESKEGNFGWAGDLAEYLEPAAQLASRNPKQLGKELPGAAIKSAGSLLSIFTPKSAVQHGLEQGGFSKGGPSLPQYASQKLADQVNKFTRKDMSEEDQQAAEVMSDAESMVIDLLGPEGARKLFAKGATKLSKAAKSAQRSQLAEDLIPKAPKGKPKVKGASEDEIISADKFIPKGPGTVKPLTDRVTKGPANKATQRRMERHKTPEKIPDREREIKFREEELKQAPRRTKQIAESEEKGRLSREKKTNLGPKGQESKARRQKEAQEKLPDLQASFRRTSERLRSLEDKVDKSVGKGKQQMEDLLKDAAKDFQEADSALQAGIANLKGHSVKEGVGGMTRSGQRIVTDIQDQIASGKPVKLSLSNYNPKHITKANALSKGKPLPKAGHNDAYTQIHDTYSKVYKDRLADVEKEILAGKKGKDLASAQKVLNLEKEKDALKKMINSANAESFIHRHNLGLRHMGKRVRSQEKMKGMTKTPKGNEPSKTESFIKNQAKEANTSAKRSRVISDGIDDLAKKNPKKADKIKKEGEGIKETFDKAEKKADDIIAAVKSGEKGYGADYFKRHIKSLFDDVRELKSSFPNIFNSDLGIDIIKGITGAFADGFLPEIGGYKLPGLSLAGVLWGKKQRTRGYFYRTIITGIVKSAIHQTKIIGAKKAIENHDSEKFLSYPPSIQKKAIASHSK